MMMYFISLYLYLLIFYNIKLILWNRGEREYLISSFPSPEIFVCGLGKRIIGFPVQCTHARTHVRGPAV